MILRNQNKKRCEGDGERIRGGFWILQLLWAWGAVYGVSRMKEQLGLTDMLLLHKSLLSLFLFAAGFFLVGRMAEDWKENRCLAFSAQLLSVMLCFTELLGMGLRFMETGDLGNVSEGTQFWLQPESLRQAGRYIWTAGKAGPGRFLQQWRFLPIWNRFFTGLGGFFQSKKPAVKEGKKEPHRYFLKVGFFCFWDTFSVFWRFIQDFTVMT